MKTLSLIIGVLFLSGCSLFHPKVVHVPVDPPKWPSASEELMKKCEALKELKPVKEGELVRFNDLLNNLVENYTIHYKCSLKNDKWQEWYKLEKSNYEGAVEKAKSEVGKKN